MEEKSSLATCVLLRKRFSSTILASFDFFLCCGKFSLLKCTSNEVFVFNEFWQNWKMLNIRVYFRASSGNVNSEKIQYICFETLFWTQFCFFENFSNSDKKWNPFFHLKRTFNKVKKEKNISVVAVARRLVLVCLCRVLRKCENGNFG